MRSKNKSKYILFWCIGLAFIVLPVVIYNGINYDIFTKVSAMKLTFSTMLGFAMIGIAALTKMKSKAGIYILFIGALLTVLGEAADQIGWSLLLIGAGMLIDKLIFAKIALGYKVKWYEEIGRTVTYTKSID